jgi:hypothetical protein
MKSLASNLQKEINYLQETQKRMTEKVKNCDKKYNIVLDSIQGFKKNMEEQDMLMRNIMSSISKQDNTNNSTMSISQDQQDLLKMMDAYNTVSTASEDSLNRITEAVTQNINAPLPLSMSTTPIPSIAAPTTPTTSTAPPTTLTTPTISTLATPAIATIDNTSMIPIINASVPSRKRKRNQPGWSVPPRVLLVDDDSIFRRLSTRLLQIAGCTIDVAVDGMEAVRKLGTGKYDLVLMVKYLLYYIMMALLICAHSVGYYDAKARWYVGYTKHSTIRHMDTHYINDIKHNRSRHSAIHYERYDGRFTKALEREHARQSIGKILCTSGRTKATTKANAFTSTKL